MPPKVTKSDLIVLAKPNPDLWKTNTEYRQFASFDPAAINLAVRIERRYFDGRVNVLFFDKVCVDHEETTGVPIFIELEKLLERLDPLLSECHFILSEKQNSISNGMGQVHSNAKVQRISGFMMATFMVRYGRCQLFPLIAEVSPKLKGKMFDFLAFSQKDKLSYAQTKTVGVKLCLKFLEDNNDQESIVKIKSTDKKDDLADTVLQTESFVRGFYDLKNDNLKINL